MGGRIDESPAESIRCLTELVGALISQNIDFLVYAREKVAEYTRQSHRSKMIAERIPELEKLSTEETLLIANELWADVEKRQEEIPFNDAAVELLDRRTEEFHKDPQSAVTWEEFKRRPK